MLPILYIIVQPALIIEKFRGVLPESWFLIMSPTIIFILALIGVFLHEIIWDYRSTKKYDNKQLSLKELIIRYFR